MNILLTDLLTCPRCGPEFGLILLGDRIEERRIMEGALGCPNCREQYPVRDGFGDLRAPPRRPLPPVVEEPEPEEDDEVVTRIAAVLGVREGPGYLVLVGPVARVAPRLSSMLERIEVVAVASDLRSWTERDGVSRMVAGPGLPFFSRRMRGVVLDGDAGAPYLEEALRVVGPGSRVAVLDADRGTAEALSEGGLEPVLQDDGVVVAARRAGS